MNQQTAMRALIGKDARIIFPLVVIGWIGCLFFNFLLFLLWQYWDVDNRSLFSGSISIWTLIPGLIAFGAASMLIGTEEDSGTLSWLRTLPVSWQQIAASKLVVGLGAFASVFAFASLILWLFSHGWRGVATSSGYNHLSLYEGSAVLFFQLLLLMLGFVVSYCIRMPVAGLIALLPVFGLVCFFVMYVTFVMKLMPTENHGELSLMAFPAGAGFLLLIGLVQHTLARRRLTRPDSSRWVLPQEMLVNPGHYRPPSMGVSQKPSQAAALLWQQCRQTAPVCVSLIGLSLILMLLYATTRDRPVRSGGVLMLISGGLAPLFITLSASWIGVLTFYADNRHRRYAFLADRGISPTKVWWTRLVPTLVGALFLMISLVAIGHLVIRDMAHGWSEGWQITSLIIVMYAFGQLVSQWIERPVLAFLAAPAYTGVCILPISYFLEGSTLPWIGLAVPVLLFASWHLSKPWLEGRNKTAQTIQVVGYTLLAIAMPCLMHLAVNS